ncbi:unnamed protein product [Calypogeia fissa]
MKLEGEWKPNCWIIDVADEEQGAIRQVFPEVPITFCTWHVRRAWTKNIVSKVFYPMAKAQINAELGAIMYSDGTRASNPVEGSDVNTSQPSAGNTSQTTDNSQPKRGRGQSANTRKPSGRKAAVSTNQGPGARGFPVGPKATRARKSRVAPPFPLEKVLEQATNSRALQQPLAPRTSNLIGTMRVGSSQAWAQTPNFQEILRSFSDEANCPQ